MANACNTRRGGPSSNRIPPTLEALPSRVINITDESRGCREAHPALGRESTGQAGQAHGTFQRALPRLACTGPGHHNSYLDIFMGGFLPNFKEARNWFLFGFFFYTARTRKKCFHLLCDWSKFHVTFFGGGKSRFSYLMQNILKHSVRD